MRYSANIIINAIKAGLLILISQPFLYSSCRKNGTKPCVNGGYSFRVTSEWSPQREIYSIGDTINLMSVFPKTLTDQINPSLVIDYSNSVGIQGDVTTYYLDTIINQPVAARDSFQLISIIGSFSERPGNRQAGININYFESGTNYQFKGAFVCKKRGIYAFFISNLLSNGLRGKNCTNAGFSNTLINTNKNITLFEYAMGRPPVSQYEIDRIYCFRVQ
jgi:hypothetical protein